MCLKTCVEVVNVAESCDLYASSTLSSERMRVGKSLFGLGLECLELSLDWSAQVCHSSFSFHRCLGTFSHA